MQINLIDKRKEVFNYIFSKNNLKNMPIVDLNEQKIKIGYIVRQRFEFDYKFEVRKKFKFK